MTNRGSEEQVKQSGPNLAFGVSRDKALAGIRERVSSGFKIAHVTIQVEKRGRPAGETHLWSFASD